MKRYWLAKTLVPCLVAMVSWGGSISQSPAQDKITLTYFSWGLAEEIWGRMLKELAVEFEKSHPDIRIELQSTTFGDKESVYTTRCEAGLCPDIADFTFDIVPLFAKKGYIKSLDPLIAKEPQGFIEQWNKAARDPVTVDGHLYMMPAAFYPWVLVYNSRLYANAGLDPTRPPATMDEFLDYAKTLTRDTNGDGQVDQWGFGMTAGRTLGLFSRFSGFLWSAGGDYLTADGKCSALDSPEALRGVEFFVELSTVHGVAHPGAVEMGPHDVRIVVANEKAAMNVGTAFTPGIINNINPDLHAFNILQFAPFPSFGDKPVYTQATMVGQVVSAKTKHPEQAWEFVKFMNNFDNQLKSWNVNGWTSARLDVSGSKAIAADKFGRVLAANQGRVKFPPAIEEWPEIADIVITALQNSLTRTQTTKQALLDAHDKVNDLLNCPS